MLLDNYDVKILGLLQKDSKISQRELSEAVNLSPSAVNRRIAALESSGVIAGTVCVIDPSAVGHPITILVEVRLESERLDLLDDVKTRFSAAHRCSRSTTSQGSLTSCS
jgi:DNA-binding Lrp family transcriptional regulator